jgi:signal transduction histidine kinase
MANALIKNGLTGAISDFVQKLSSTNTIHADLEIVGMEERLNPTLETVLFRVFQELITNIIRHAKARQLSIQLIRHEQELVLVIEDDGVGFDSSQSKNSEGVGLKNIRSRVEYFKGQVHIDSTPDKGTTITVEIPV